MSDKTIIRTTCPRDCYDACGIAVVKRADGLVKVLGDPEHPVSRGALCGKCAIAYNGAWLDPKARVTRPLKRVGPKGEGRFEPVSWDAGDWRDRRAAARTLSRRHGAETDLAHALHRHLLAARRRLSAALLQPARRQRGRSGFDLQRRRPRGAPIHVRRQRRRLRPAHAPRTPNCILVWGANPFASAPHQHKHWLKEATAKKIVVDPGAPPDRRRRPTCICSRSRAATPRSPSPCCMCWCAKARIDRAFLAAAHDRLGRARADASCAARRTGRRPSPAFRSARSKRRRRIYGEGPSLLWLGQGLQRQPTGGNVFRAVGLLPAATGNLAKPGAGFLYLNGSGRRGIDGDYLEAPHLRQGREAQGQPHGSGRHAERSQEGAGARHLEHQHRRLQSRPGAPASRAARRATVPRRGRSLPDRHHRLRRLSCCRPRASWSSTISCRPISICRCRRR